MNIEELHTALKALEKERGISSEYMLEQIKKAISIACKSTYGGNDNVIINFDDNGFEARLMKTVAEEVTNYDYEISLDDARKIDPNAAVGDMVGIDLDPMQFGRIAVQTARSIIRQGIRDGEKGQMFQEFKSRMHELATVTVERIDPRNGNITIRLGKADAVLPKSEQIGTENVHEGDHMKIYVSDVKETERGPRIIITRKHVDFVRRLFEQEVPEIYDGTIEIKSISREAGSRTKMAVLSKNSEVDAVGSCIGARGARVNSIVDELGGEKIDIIEYSEDPAKFIAASLAPANVLSVEITEGEDVPSCRVTVPDSQLSLAIGNKGQNARLAARLTGWKIDIKPESGFFGEDDDIEVSDNNTETDE